MQGIDVEFDRQRDELVARGYPALVGMSPIELTTCIEPLREIAQKAANQLARDNTNSHAPFVVVVSASLARAEDLVPATSLSGGSVPGIVDRNHGEDGLASYLPIAEVELPAAPVYLLVDIERGEEFCGIRPADALPQILNRGRTPLTIHEGIALVTQFPGMLEKNRCFMPVSYTHLTLPTTPYE